MSPAHRMLPMRQMLTLIILLVAAWLLWSGLYKPLLLFFGVVSCGLTFWLVRRMGYFDDVLYTLGVSTRLLRYWFWLGGEVVRSSLEVARIVLDPKLPISPRLVEIQIDSDHPLDQVILGNSITLTPGTLTIDLFDGKITAHAITEASARELAAGEMNRRVAQLRES